jgi:hypothetical protein
LHWFIGELPAAGSFDGSYIGFIFCVTRLTLFFSNRTSV